MVHAKDPNPPTSQVPFDRCEGIRPLAGKNSAKRESPKRRFLGSPLPNGLPFRVPRGFLQFFSLGSLNLKPGSHFSPWGQWLGLEERGLLPVEYFTKGLQSLGVSAEVRSSSRRRMPAHAGAGCPHCRAGNLVLFGRLPR